MSAELTFDIWRSIHNTKAQYFRALDTKHWDEWGAVFTEDAVLQVPERNNYTGTGRSEIVAHVRESLEHAITVHHGHMGEISLIDGDHADVIWAMEDIVIYDGLRGENSATHVLQGYGHYFERYGNDGDAWRIERCRLVRIHTETTRVTQFRDSLWPLG